MGNNWYCESGNPNENLGTNGVLSNDPLWDGVNCEGACCSDGKSPPWFSVDLPAPTTDYIEALICANEHSGGEDVFISILFNFWIVLHAGAKYTLPVHSHCRKTIIYL